MFRGEIIDRYSSIYGKEFFNACFRPVKRSIRVNTLKIKPAELARRLGKQRFVLKKGFADDSYVVERERKMLGGTLEHLLGYFFIQELTSMLPVQWLRPEESDKVLDMCASPGGKTTHLSQFMDNKGLVVAVDNDKSKNVPMINNLQRMGCRNVVFDNCDATSVIQLRKYKTIFDKVLLDAPCSCSGVLYKDSEISYKLSLNFIRHYSIKQKRLVSSAYKLLKTKGRLVYSTCSIDPLENGEVVAYAETLGFRLLRKKQFLPHKDGTPGFFVAEMIKK